MSILLPATTGGAIAASDSNAISTELDASGLPVGTVVWNSGVGSFFTKTVSAASLVTDQILAVLNEVGTRWIITSGASVTTNATLSGAGTGLSPLTVVSAPLPTNAAAFTAALSTATETLKGLVPSDQFSSMFIAAAHLGDASVTITPGSSKKSLYIIPPATLTADRTIKIGAAGAATGDSFYLVIQDIGNHTVTVTNNADAPLITPNGASIGAPKRYLFYFTSDWNFFLAGWTV